MDSILRAIDYLESMGWEFDTFSYDDGEGEDYPDKTGYRNPELLKNIIDSIVGTTCFLALWFK